MHHGKRVTCGLYKRLDEMLPYTVAAFKDVSCYVSDLFVFDHLGVT